MQRKSVSSSNLAAVGYNEKEQILEIEFNHGGVYQYFNVPKEEHEALMSAGSHGSYFYHNIRGCYEYDKL
jgi:KTSC domain